MAEWPKKRPVSIDPDELYGRWAAEDLIEVMPADLGRELYEALDDAIKHNVNATENDSAGWTQEEYDAWAAARDRYEREVGDD